MTIIKENKKAGVRWEQSEEDGRYKVLAADELLVETSVNSLAEIIYQEAVAERSPANVVRERERAHFEMQAVRSDSFDRRATNSHKKGGRGGRGGV